MVLELLENVLNFLFLLLVNKSEDIDVCMVVEISLKILFGLGNILRIFFEDVRYYGFGFVIGKYWYNVDKIKVL